MSASQSTAQIDPHEWCGFGPDHDGPCPPRVGDVWLLDGRRYRVDEIAGERVFYTVLGARAEGVGSIVWLMAGERVR